ncbi:MptD family putative ECF transporter S component [Clostridiaceae bacterium M8S5]|nr:MptD family putative ECF transporter S component [Clostridiaceae bacterium M8S5]
MNNKMNVKDLISIGIFTVLYFIMFFISGTTGYIPIFVAVLPLILGILTGIPFILFITKVNKFGMVTIMGALVGALSFLIGRGWMALVGAVVCGIIADLIFKSGDYKSWPKIVIGTAVFNIWIVAAMLPLWLMREAYFAAQKGVASQEYLDAINALLPNWMLPGSIILAIVGGVIGAYIGRATLKKHFRRAGIA